MAGVLEYVGLGIIPNIFTVRVLSPKLRGGVDGRQTCVTTFVNTDILTYLCDLYDL